VVADETETNPNNNSATVRTVLAAPGAIRGRVYIDGNRNGGFDTGETAIPNVTVTLSGNNFLGQAVNQTMQTDANGEYNFSSLLPGTYTVVQSQPPNFVDASETAGNNGASINGNDSFSVNLQGGADSVGNNFGENILDISKRRFLASNN
jgi:hypothetical protein